MSDDRLEDVYVCDRCQRQVNANDDEWFQWETDGTSLALICPGCLTTQDKEDIADHRAAVARQMALIEEKGRDDFLRFLAALMSLSRSRHLSTRHQMAAFSEALDRAGRGSVREASEWVHQVVLGLVDPG